MGMAVLIRGSDHGTDAKTNEIDWDQETLLSDFAPIPISSLPLSPNSNTGQTVLLMGATGFIGRYIINLVCRNKNVTSIHCVAVRSLDSLQDVATAFPHVYIHADDLTSPLLGLSQSVFSSFAASVTTIVHNGAAVSFLQPYASLRAANVTSTKELIRLAAPRCIPLHYISTAGVAELTNLSSLREASVAEHIPPIGASGYTTSKWASEVVLEKASALFGVPIIVHRPSSVVEVAGKPNEVPLHDALQNLLRCSRELRAVPRLEGWTECFDMVPVDEMARRITDDVLSHVSSGIRYKHVAGSRTVPVQSLDKFIGTQIGGLVDVILMQEWAGRARVFGLREDLGEWFVAMASEARTLPAIEMGPDKGGYETRS
jgi:thioester reductase-like protein